MRVQRVTVLTHEDVENDRPGTNVVVGMAEYLAWSRKHDRPAIELLEGGIDLEGWAFVTWSRLRRSKPDETPEFEEWTAGIAQALPVMFIKALERAEASVDDEIDAALGETTTEAASAALDPTESSTEETALTTTSTD